MQDEAQLATLPVDEGAAGPEQPAVAQCPRCEKPLIDPNGLGWCKSCGYCKSLETEKSNQLLARESGPSRGAAMAGAVGHVPIWFWVLLLGIGGVAGLSLAAGRSLPPGTNLSRAMWMSAQIGVGLFLVLAGQFVALVMIAPEDEKLSFKDALMSTRLWSLALKRMPRLSVCLWTSAWGAALIVFAFVFIGGLGHWLTYLPGAKNGPAASRSWK